MAEIEEVVVVAAAVVVVAASATTATRLAILLGNVQARVIVVEVEVVVVVVEVVAARSATTVENVATLLGSAQVNVGEAAAVVVVVDVEVVAVTTGSVTTVENPDIFLGIAHKAERVVVAVAEDLASATSVMKRDTWHETVPTRTRPIEDYAD